jgi:hypothetical protein
MELARSLIKKAEALLQASPDLAKPLQLAPGLFYLARGDDMSVLAHGVVLHNGVEYKVGTLRLGVLD